MRDVLFLFELFDIGDDHVSARVYLSQDLRPQHQAKRLLSAVDTR